MSQTTSPRATFPKGPTGFEWPRIFRERFTNPVALIQRIHDRHGPVVGIRLGKMSQILVNDPALVRYVLVENPSAFKKGFGYGMLEELLGNGIVNSDGETWKTQRRLVQPAMNQDRFRDYAGSVVEVVDSELTRLEALVSDDPIVDLYKFFSDLALRIICKTVLGLEFETQVRQLQYCVDLLMAFISREQLGPRARLKQFLGYRSHHIPDDLAGSIAQLDQTVFEIIAQRRKQSEHPEGSFDLVGHLVRTPMSDRQIRDEVVTMFTAGYETTATALSWGSRLLAENEDCQHALVEEAHAHPMTSNEATLEGLKELRAAENVFQETIRLFPPVWRITRFAKETVEFEGHLIPEGTLVVISQHSLQRDRRFWGPDAEIFRPSRFSQGCPATERHSYVPFGAGPRMCIGSQFATLEAQVVLSRLAARFKLSTIGPRPEFDAAITLRPRGGMKLRLGRLVF